MEDTQCILGCLQSVRIEERRMYRDLIIWVIVNFIMRQGHLLLDIQSQYTVFYLDSCYLNLVISIFIRSAEMSQTQFKTLLNKLQQISKQQLEHMKYRQQPRHYGTIRSRGENLSSEQNSYSRERPLYEPPDPYVPLDERFYRYAGIQHPTITLDPQAYRNKEQQAYAKKSLKKKRMIEIQDQSSSEFEQFQMNSSESSEDISCHAHQQRYVKAGNHHHHKRQSDEIDSSFELSPYQDEESESQSEGSFEREKLYKKNKKERGNSNSNKKAIKVKDYHQQQSQGLDYSGDSQAIRLKQEHQNHKRSINKIEKARNIVKQKLRTQQFEKKMKELSSSSSSEKQQQQQQNSQKLSQFVQSARFNENFEGFKKEKQKGRHQQKTNIRSQSKNRNNRKKQNNKKNIQINNQSDKESEEFTYRQKEKSKTKPSRKDKKRQKHETRDDLQDRQLISRYHAKEFYHQQSPKKPILKKPQSKSQERPNQKLSKERQKVIQERNDSDSYQQVVKQNHNPENLQRNKPSKKQIIKQIRKPVAFEIDNHREDMTLAEAFKIHRGDLREKLKEEREQFKGHHQHQKKNRRQKKKNMSKTRTFMKNKFKNTTKYVDPFESETRFTSPFTGKNNPLEEFKRMDILRRRQLIKKYDKATRLRLQC